MPNWKNVPTLRTLALRRVAWPDAVLKPINPRRNFPSVETYIRHTFISKFFSEAKLKIKKKRKHNIVAHKQPITEVTEDVLNAWIRLSNFYETRLSEFDGMSMFMQMQTIGTLDFLHEGFTLRDEKDFLKNILPFIGVVPYTLKPQKIDYRTWHDLVNVMVLEDVCETLEHLYIPFGNDRISREKHESDLNMHSPLVYRFEETMECFINLKTLVVRGDIIKDNFMLAVGENCCFLEYLDVRGTQVSDRGVILLLFQKLGKSFFQGAFLPSHCRFPVFPSDILRPCCATLKYLDVSDVPNTAISNGYSYDQHVTKACPQLRPTPLRFFFQVPGQSRVILRDFSLGTNGIAAFRQNLVRYVRQSHCERLFDFTKVVLESFHFEDPNLEVMENDFGEETAFLFKSDSAILLHCNLENLSVLTLVSYVRNVLNFIPIQHIARFAPNLQKLKASLRGGLSADFPLKSLKYLSAPAVKWLDTLESILDHCPALEYLEVRNILMLDTATQFGDTQVEDVFRKDPGAYKNMEVIRFIFPNKIMLHPGLSWIAVMCPRLKIVGDLSLWGIPSDTLMRIFANTSLYNYEFAIEHRGILHYCDKRNRMDLARFE